MTIPLTTANSGFFVKFGGMGGMVGDLNSLRGGAATTNVIAAGNMVTRFGTLETNYNTSPKIPSTFDGSFQVLASWQSQQTTLINGIVQLANATIQRMANDDAHLAQPNNTPAALTELIRQMKAAVATVQASTVAVGSQTSFGSPVSDYIIVTSLKSGAGVTQEYVLAETLRFTCTADAQTAGTKWQEQVGVTSQAAAPSQFDITWPAGSGTATGMTAIDCDQNQAGGNLLQNSGFTTFTVTNVPDNWVLVAGVAGTTVFKETTNVLRAAGASLKILGDSATTVTLRQPFNTAPSTVLGAGGTGYKPLPDVVYHFNVWIKLSNASPAAGILRFAVVDANNSYAVINDDNSTANSVTATLTGIGDTNWHNYSVAFRMPANMTGIAPQLEIQTTTSLTTAKSVYIDNMSLAVAQSLYKGGPWSTIHSGGTQMVLGDAWTIATTNTWGLFQQFAQQVFDMRGLGLQFGSAGSPSISDSLLA